MLLYALYNDTRCYTMLHNGTLCCYTMLPNWSVIADSITDGSFLLRPSSHTLWISHWRDVSQMKLARKSFTCSSNPVLMLADPPTRLLVQLLFQKFPWIPVDNSADYCATQEQTRKHLNWSLSISLQEATIIGLCKTFRDAIQRCSLPLQGVVLA